MPQVVPETEHYFAGGMYCRVVREAAGTLVVGKKHKKAHFYIIVEGAIAVVQNGAERKVYEAPSIIVSNPGTQRALFILEDSVFLTVHRTDKTDLDEIEAEQIESDQLALFDSHNQLKESLTWLGTT